MPPVEEVCSPNITLGHVLPTCHDAAQYMPTCHDAPLLEDVCSATTPPYALNLLALQHSLGV